MSDFTYTNDGLFVTIAPETPQAEAFWNDQIAPQTNNSGKVLTIHFAQVAAQLRSQGYTIRKAKATQDISDEDLLKALS